MAHAIMHLFGAIAIWDPKLQAFVVSISHGNFRVGTLFHKSTSWIAEFYGEEKYVEYEKFEDPSTGEQLFRTPDKK